MTPSCDFCGMPFVEWWYPCAPFDVHALAFSNDKWNGPVVILDALEDDMARWGACHSCSLYIDRKDFFFLAQRITRQNETPEVFGTMLSLFHEFDRQRTGEKILV